ncbi:hypothetical protein BDZ94DRAFT_1304269 [Collybia nuda]|uniref:Uncharacterized protein n=1 Tax=Collybia nuda TaxID=64659 RepID=A0A9P5YIJ0_9AGAR|nr:hypothetical protein BDZ94DRAFT_1304269 [Collybia nuda]
MLVEEKGILVCLDIMGSRGKAGMMSKWKLSQYADVKKLNRYSDVDKMDIYMQHE